MRPVLLLSRFLSQKSAGRRARPARQSRRRLRIDTLEDRTVPTVSLIGVPDWVSEGPGPITDGVGNVIGPTTATSLKVGAVNQIAVDPFNAKHLLAATVNGGIWQTADFTAASPVWTTTTDRMPSLATASVAFSPVSSNVIYAGTGSYSSIFLRTFGGEVNIGGQGGAAVGVYKSIDGGATWQIQNPGGIFTGRRIIRIIPTTLNGGQTVFAATTDGGAAGGVFRTDDGGTTWTRLSGANGLPNSGVTDLVINPSNRNQIFTATSNTIAGAGNEGVYRLDVGVSNTAWVNVTNDMAAADLAASDRIELAISSAGVNPIWVSIINATRRGGTDGDTVTTQGQFYQRVYRGVAGGGTVAWTAVGPSGGQPPDVLSGNQGDTHGSLAADSTSDTLVYVGGDRIPSGFAGTTGYVARGDSGANTWTGITPVGAASGDPGTAVPDSNPAVVTSPHADTRAMVFAAGGVLLLSCDGGVYQATSPGSGTQTWTFVGGDMQNTEFYNVSYDSQFDVIFGGAQDNGNPSQNATGSVGYFSTDGGDGGSTGVDNFSRLSSGQSVRYFGGANGGAKALRRIYTGASTRPASNAANDDKDAFILPQAGLAGITSAAANDLFAFTAVNSITGRILVAGGTNKTTTVGALYESSDAGSASATLSGGSYFVNDTWTQITTAGVPGFVQAGAVAYGGRLNGLDNPDVLYVASGSQIYVRSAAGGALTATAALPAGAGAIVSIALDPDNWKTAFVTDGTRVYQTTTAGVDPDGAGPLTAWTTVTGNLTNPPGARGAPAVLSVVGGGSLDAVLFAGTQGVFRMLTNAPGVWTRFGAGLPNAFTGGMVYNPTDDVLVNATYGRGVWEVANASATVFTPGALEVDGDTDYAGQDDIIKLMIDANNPLLLDVFINSTTPVAQVQLGTFQQINVNGYGGNDRLIVDSSNGLINVANGIHYDGGTGFNNLQLVQTGGAAQAADGYSVGPDIGSGTSVITGPGGTQSVFFENLDPVLDLVPAATLTVNATPSNNAISYATGTLVTQGKVTVDDQESIEFANKTSLVLNGGAGTDTVSLNNANTPTGLTGITVNGGDPTSGDSLIVNGTAATVSVNTSARTITGAGPVGIGYDAAIEALTVNAGPSTTLAISGSAGYVYTPGAATSAGTVQTDVLPIAFTGIGAGESLTLSGSSAIINGTAGNDTFTASGSAGTVTLAGRATIGGTAVASATVDGQDGTDTVNATGNGGAVTAALGGATANLSGGGLGTMRVPNVEVVNLSAGAGGITVNGTAGPDAYVVTPTGANTASVQVGGAPPVLNTNNTGSLTVADGFAGDGDTLTVNGTSASETIGVTTSAVTVGALKAVGYTAANIESLTVNGNAGSDTFNVTTGSVPIFVDGGDPIGVLPGDLLNVQTGGNPATFTGGPHSDEGGFVVGSNQPLSFAHIESLTVTGGGSVVLNGTNGNDVFTIIARDASTHAGADGVQDFTTSLNAGPEFLFLNVPSLTFNALSGDDTLVLQTPAPNHADWNVNVTVDGGAPSASDKLTVETPGTNTVVYTPASPNSGTLVIKGAVNDTPVTINDIEQFLYDGMSGNDTFTIAGTAGPNTFYVTPGATPDAGTLAMDTTLSVSFQNLGTSGRVNIAGNGGANTLVYYGTSANDLFTIDASSGGGVVTLNNRVPVFTSGVATLRAEGYAGDDTFTLVPAISASPFTTLLLNGGDQASAIGDQTNLKGTAGPDSIGVSGQVVTLGGVTVASSGVENINLDSGGGLPPDLLTYTGVPGVTEAISLAGSSVKGAGVLSVPGVTKVTFTNTETFLVNGQPADNDTLTVFGTNAVDLININLAAAGTSSDPVLKLLNAAGTLLELTLLNYTGFNVLNVNALDGNDIVNVYTAATIPGGLTGRNVFVDGGLPTGKNKGTDTLNVYYLGKRPHIVHSATTQSPDDGLNTLDYGTAFYSVQYASMEVVNILKQ